MFIIIAQTELLDSNPRFEEGKIHPRRACCHAMPRHSLVRRAPYVPQMSGTFIEEKGTLLKRFELVCVESAENQIGEKKKIVTRLEHALKVVICKSVGKQDFNQKGECLFELSSMAGCLTDLAKTYVEKLINGAIAETRPVFCFTCIANEFEEEKVRLEAERITLEQRAKVAAGRDKDIQANVCFWEEEVDKIIQEDIKTKKTCFFGLCPDCIWRYKRGKELANKMEEIKRLTEKGEKLENIELPRRLPDVERYSSEYYIAFKSRESKYKELLDALKDDNNYIIGLQGMGGTGKTTLAKEVGKELKQSEQFSHVIDTTVSFNPDIKKIQDDIAGPLGLKWEDCNDSDRPKKLWSRLINGEKILLIMDDVWDRDIPLDFDQIGIPKRDNHKGCRILITTRSKRIFNKMDCDKNIELELLSEEESWTMFKRYAGISDSSSKNLISKGRKIANECKRLPVAIAVIASSLKGQQLRKHEWDVTLKSLKKHVSMHGVDDYLVGIYKCLKISYDYMKDEKAKGLFLLSSVFPEDKEISIGVLTRLGIGTGLLGEDYGSYDDARNQVVVAKNKLIDSCLLVEVGERLVKMHDLVRDAAQWIANKEIRGVNLSNKDQKSSVEREKNIKYLFCEGKDMDFFSCKYDGSKLETLIVNMDRDEDHKCTEVPISFFENIVKLRVLYFSANGKQPLSLPHSIQSLANIRSMLIEQVDLGDISVLGNLQSLETLDLIKCTIIELPHKITKLGKFKLLTLAGCEIRRNNPFEVIERCSALEELYFLDSDDAYFFSKETFKYCMQTAEVLQLDGIKEGWKNLMPEIVPIDLGMNDLVELRLRCISQLQCLIDTIGSQVPKVLLKLVVLELNRMENLKELFNGSLSFDSLKNLEKLLIKDCQNFQSLFNCKLNLCNLKTVTLQKCPMLVSLFPLSTFRNLVLLEKLHIVDCEGLKNIIKDERREEESIEEINESDNDNKSYGSMFPKLKVLHIEGCHRLESVLPILSCQDLQVSHSRCLQIWERVQCLPVQPHIMCNIKEITLSHFLKIKSVFTLSIAPRMLVETLSIRNCHELKHILVDIGDHDSGGNNWGDVFPKLKSVYVEDCMQLEYIVGQYSENHQNHTEIHLHLPALQCLNLCNLPSLVAMCPKQYCTTFPPLKELELKKCNQIAIKSIGEFIIHSVSESLDSINMKELTGSVEHFSALESLMNQNLLNSLSSKTCLPKLKTLAVVKCYKLKCVFPVSICKELPELKALVITEADELEEIFKSECDQKVQIPNLNIVVFDKLPSLFQTEGIQFEAAKNRFVQNCQNLSLTSTLTPSVIFDIQYRLGTDFETMKNLLNPFQQLQQESKDHDPGDENLSAETNKDNSVGIEVETALGHELTSSQIQMKQIPEAQHEIVENDPDVEIPSVAILPMNLELVNEQSMSQQYLTNQQHPHAEIDTVVIPSRGNDCLNETEDQLNHEGYTPVKIVAATMSTISDARNELPIQLEQDVDVGETMDTAKTNDDQVSPNDDVVMKVSSIIEEHFSKDDEFRVSKSKPSPSNNIPLPLAFQTPSMPYEVKTSQIMEDFSSPSLVMRELEQLVSKKHLDYENLSLLTDFLVKHPSVILRDTSLSNRYKGYAYNCLAELLKFLQTHSVLDVLGSCHFEFVEILQDVRRFGFDKDWLDGVEKRALFPDLQFSQDALLTLLDSKKQVTKDVEVMRSKIDILTQHVEDLKHQLTSSEAILESIIQQEAQVLESKAALSAPLGY
ncbi:putative CC-NBS-LRR resistance protein [Trifolium pratense]|uniref:Putative CC-NBS-LRR resistance protein n=1 Tax=Trifolium pratense TaxID=57577 RepID=A0A2K3NNN0_TRIPR|nr:putative CC-NBS-LRR resistance protein [Trifolium pratense]